jgi:ribonucleoside-diphosphate reductase alpha chain
MLQGYLSKVKPFTITIDLSRDKLITDYGKQTLKDRYLLPEEVSPQENFARAACAFADDEQHAQRLYDYASKLWFGFATPVLCNAGTERGLPISCFLNYTEDSCEGLAENYAEDIFLSRYGGGIGTYMGNIRSLGEVTSKGNRTTGLIPFLKVKDSLSMAFQQGSNRRGSCAVYVDVSHPEIEEFIEIRRPTRAEDRRTMYIHHAINISDAFMNAVVTDDEWNLVDPNSKKVKKTVRARELFATILKARMETGEPYLHFIDTSNRDMPQALRMRGLKIHTSNLCNEIYLPTAPDRTAVCCLSSVNLEKYLEWKDNELFIEDLIRMLDNVLQNFIDNAHPQMWRAVNSARKERSLGLGAMGFHSFLQSMNLSFESVAAATWNQKMFAQILNQAKIASGKLAEERGEAPDMKGTGFRNAHVMAIAPTASNSIICGETSPSVEPWSANGFNKKTLNGTKTYKNKYLEKTLESMGKNTDEVWHSIITNEGSVQHLDFLDECYKEVFKTAFEIDQEWIIEHASVRQKFIDQGQSINLFFDPLTKFGKLYNVHKKAWQGGLKGLYYLRSFSKKRAENGGTSLYKENVKPETEYKTEEINDNNKEECLMCSG